jgi:hypothetical protein
LVALVLLMAGWTGARMLLWHSPFPSPFVAAVAASAGLAPPPLTPVAREGQARPLLLATPANRSPSASTLQTLSGAPGMAVSPERNVWSGIAGQLGGVVPSPDRFPPNGLVPQSDRFLVQQGIALPPQEQGRWHLAGWVAWRSGSGIPRRVGGAQPASYGGTQAGAAARFDLAADGHRPALHARATYAPGRPSQAEFAAGAGLRPLPQLPLRVIAEVRATRSQDTTEVRPAVLAVTEIAPIALPLGLTAEGYGQAGWVGGRYATAFADGQARVTREVASSGAARIHVGGGAWGGAQKFAERLDVGPTIGVDIDAGPVTARLAVDYRLQVAGDAAPGDGVALTLSTGF